MSGQLEQIKILAKQAEKASITDLRKKMQALIEAMIKWMEAQERK